MKSHTIVPGVLLLLAYSNPSKALSRIETRILVHRSSNAIAAINTLLTDTSRCGTSCH